MQKNKLYFLVIFMLVPFINCTSISQKKDLKDNLSLSFVETLKLKETTQNDVLKILGQPDRKVQPIHFPKTAWIYNDSKLKLQRLSMVFSNDGKLSSLTWQVFDQEKELDINSAMARFPRAHFVSKDAEWINPHIAPNERFYLDSAKGIQITFGIAREEVKSISWFDPQEKEIERRPATKWIKFTREDGLVSIKPANPNDLIW